MELMHQTDFGDVIAKALSQKKPLLAEIRLPDGSLYTVKVVDADADSVTAFFVVKGSTAYHPKPEILNPDQIVSFKILEG